jgi:hypothetical protein
MFQLYEAFERQPGVEPDIVHRLRRQWIKRLLAAVSAGQWRDLWSSDLLISIFRHDPLALPVALFVYLPKRTLRQIGQTLRISKRVKTPHSPFIYPNQVHVKLSDSQKDPVADR